MRGRGRHKTEADYEKPKSRARSSSATTPKTVCCPISLRRPSSIRVPKRGKMSRSKGVATHLAGCLLAHRVDALKDRPLLLGCAKTSSQWKFQRICADFPQQPHGGQGPDGIGPKPFFWFFSLRQTRRPGQQEQMSSTGAGIRPHPLWPANLLPPEPGNSTVSHPPPSGPRPASPGVLCAGPEAARPRPLLQGAEGRVRHGGRRRGDAPPRAGP